eukprot:472941_1
MRIASQVSVTCSRSSDGAESQRDDGAGGLHGMAGSRRHDMVGGQHGMVGNQNEAQFVTQSAVHPKSVPDRQLHPPENPPENPPTNLPAGRPAGPLAGRRANRLVVLGRPHEEDAVTVGGRRKVDDMWLSRSGGTVVLSRSS